jgi:hypothetical protein
MAILRFRPEIWSAALLVALQKKLVYAQPGVVNRDYEGEITQAGDTVRITSISDPTIGTYVPNVTAIAPEELTDAQRTLVVDQAKYFAFFVDDVDKRQAKGDVMPTAMARAAYKLADQADQFVAGLYTGIQSANAVNSGSAITFTAVGATATEEFYNKVLVPLKVKLDEANVPTEGRWCVVPPWAHAMLLLSSLFSRFDGAGQQRGVPQRHGRPGGRLRHPRVEQRAADHDRLRGHRGRRLGAVVRGADQQDRGLPAGGEVRRRRQGPVPVRRQADPPGLAGLRAHHSRHRPVAAPPVRRGRPILSPILRTGAQTWPAWHFRTATWWPTRTSSTRPVSPPSPAPVTASRFPTSPRTGGSRCRSSPCCASRTRRVAPGTISLLAATNPPNVAGGQGNLTTTVANSTTQWIGPFESNRFIQSDGSLIVESSVVMTVTAFRVPAAA